MTQDQWTAVDRYFTDLPLPFDPLLDAALRQRRGRPAAARRVGGHGQAAAVAGAGTGGPYDPGNRHAGVYSTIWLARVLPPGGPLVRLETDANHAEVARANIARAGLGDKVEVRLGHALDTLPQRAAEGRGAFDLIFIDADKQHNPDYLAWALKLSRPGSLIIADNVVRRGAVVDAASDDPSVRGVRRFVELLAEPPRERHRDPDRGQQGVRMAW
jgi:O-methyltransferase